MGDDGLHAKLDRLPQRPGVYLFKNARGETIYIGKAKSLRPRVRSYFQPSAAHPPRTARLVAEVVDLEFIVVDTEMEALILESNLVKRQRPRFNVVLRNGVLELSDVKAVKKHGFVLTPGRYVGAEDVEDDGEPFADKYPRLLTELEACFGEGERLTAAVRLALEGIDSGS